MMVITMDFSRPIIEPNFKINTIEWLGNWLSGGKELTILPQTIKKELNQYIPTDNIVLYRGLLTTDIIHNIENKQCIKFEFVSSWTYDKQMALNFGDKVIMTTFEPKHVIIDTTIVSSDFIMMKCSGFPDELECIIDVGIYEFSHI
jgi:hypothetical protein